MRLSRITALGMRSRWAASAQQGTQIFRHVFKTTRAQPALRLLLHGVPRRQIVGHHPPRTTRAHKPPQPVEEFAQGMFALRRVFFHQRQIRRAERPLFVAHITRITLACFRHPQLFTYSV